MCCQQPQIPLPFRPFASDRGESMASAVHPAGGQVRRESHAQRAHALLVAGAALLEALEHCPRRSLTLRLRAERGGLEREVLEGQEAVPAHVVQERELVGGRAQDERVGDPHGFGYHRRRSIRRYCRISRSVSARSPAWCASAMRWPIAGENRGSRSSTRVNATRASPTLWSSRPAK